MIRHLGARAIAAACHVSAPTVRRWRKAQLRGEECPLAIRETATGRIWCSESDVEKFFSGPEEAREAIREKAREIRARLGHA